MDQSAEHTDKPSKTINYLAVILLSVVVFCIALTQLLAYHFDYAAWLGQPLVGHFYNPFRFYEWLQWGVGEYPLVVLQYGLISFFLAFMTLMSGLAYTGRFKVRKRTTHGTSHWAVRQDLVDSNLLDTPQNDHSVLLGGWPNGSGVEYIIHSGPESVLLYAPSRSGKGVSVVGPNLLSYESSVFVLDIKGELWEQTAGWRQRSANNLVLYHDPCSEDPGNARFNPLAEIRINTSSDVRDVQNVVEYLIKPEKGKSGDHWILSAKTLMTGVILHVLYKGGNDGEIIGLSHVLEAITNPQQPIRELFDEMMEYPHRDGVVHPAVAQVGADMQNKEDRELSGVVSTASSQMSIFRDPILADACSRSDFKIMDLVENEKPVSLYLIIRPSDRDRLQRYFSLLVNLVCRRLTEKLPTESEHRHHLLLMLDEFSSLPSIPIVQESLDVFAGYKVQAMIVMQDYQRLIALYGREETISSNCKVRIAYPPNRPETAELISKLTGTTTVVEKFRNTSGKLLAPMASSVSNSVNVYSRPLLTADEVMRLLVPKLDTDDRMIEAGAALIFARGCFPILGVQTPFFFDEHFIKRAAHPAPDYSDTVMA